MNLDKYNKALDIAEGITESVEVEYLDKCYEVLDKYAKEMGFETVIDRKDKKYIKNNNTNYVHFLDFNPDMDNDQLKWEVRTEKGDQYLCNTYGIYDAVDMDTSMQLIRSDLESME